MRFYTLHFLLPSILALLSLLHIVLLHETGSSSPLGIINSYQRFSRFCIVKDGLGIYRSGAKTFVGNVELWLQVS